MQNARTLHIPISIQALSLSSASECSSTYGEEYACVASSWTPRHHLEYKLEKIKDGKQTDRLHDASPSSLLGLPCSDVLQFETPEDGSDFLFFSPLTTHYSPLNLSIILNAKRNIKAETEQKHRSDALPLN
jgi:hypothetical protein